MESSTDTEQTALLLNAFAIALLNEDYTITEGAFGRLRMAVVQAPDGSGEWGYDLDLVPAEGSTQGSGIVGWAYFATVAEAFTEGLAMGRGLAALLHLGGVVEPAPKDPRYPDV